MDIVLYVHEEKKRHPSSSIGPQTPYLIKYKLAIMAGNRVHERLHRNTLVTIIRHNNSRSMHVVDNTDNFDILG